MATLRKKHAKKIIANMLSEIFDENCYSFPEKFEVFSEQLVKKLYSKFKFIEGNPIIFERTMSLDNLPNFEMNHSFELIE